MGAIPYYVNKGAFTIGTGAISVPVPAGYADGDVFILLVSTANQAITTPDGWTEVTNSPQYTGSAGDALGVRLGVFWKYVSGAQSAVSVADSGSYTAAQIFCFRGCNQTNPIHITAGTTYASSYSPVCPAVTTSIANCLILLCVGLDRDANDTANLSGWSNGNLSSLAEVGDETGNSGTGGGIGLAIGGKAGAGNTGTTSVNQATANPTALITVALAPTPPAVIGADVTETTASSDSQSGNIPATAGTDESIVPAESPNAGISFGSNHETQSGIADAPNGRISEIMAGAQDEEATPADMSDWGTTPRPTGTPALQHYPEGGDISGSFSVTVPADAEIALIVLYLDSPTSNPDSHTLSIGGKASDFVMAWTNDSPFVVKKILLPPTGVQTLTWSSPIYIYVTDITVVFFKDIDQGTPIVGTWQTAQVYFNTRAQRIYPVSPTEPFCATVIFAKYQNTDAAGLTADGQILVQSTFHDYFDEDYYIEIAYKTTDTNRIYITYIRTLRLAAVILRGKLKGIEADCYQATSCAISDSAGGSSPDAKSSDTINAFALEGPYATINSSAPLVISPAVQVNLSPGQTINIPASTEVIVLFCTSVSASDFYDYVGEDGERTFFYLNGVPFQLRVKTIYDTTNLAAVAAYVFVNPPPGDHVFSWDCYSSSAPTYSLFVLNFLKNIDIITDPVVSAEPNMFGNTYNDYFSPGSYPQHPLTHAPGDIMIGMVCSNNEFEYTAEYPPMAGYPAPPSPLVHYAHVTKGLASTLWGGNHCAVGISVGPATSFGIIPPPSQTPPAAVALCLRCKNAPEWIDTLLNDVSIPETVATSDRAYVREAENADFLSSLLPVVIDGSYVDIPGGVVNAPRAGCHAYTITSSPANVGISISHGVNLFVIMISSHWLDADTWLNSCTLTLNGVEATHHALLEYDEGFGIGRAILVAYVKNPTSGTLVVEISNPHYGNSTEGECDSDLFTAFQVKYADVSGVPISWISSLASGVANSLTIPDISYILGDMVVGVLSSDGPQDWPTKIGPYTYFARAFDYFYDTNPPYTDWYQALTVGCSRIGGDSSILLNNFYQDNLCGFAFTIKCGGDVIGETLNDAATASSAAGSAATGFLSFSGDDAISLAIDSDSPAAIAFVGNAEGQGEISDASETIASTLAAGTESATVTNAEDADAPPWAYITSAAAATASMSGVRVAVAKFGRIDVLRVREQTLASGILYAESGNTMLSEAVYDAERIQNGVVVDYLAAEDVTGRERFADVIAAETFFADEQATSMAILWGFAVDTHLPMDLPAATADTFTNVLDILTIVDGYSAIRIECYFPAMTVTYGEARYSAALNIQATAAIYNGAIMATQDDTGIEAVIIPEEITATLSASDLEAVYAGAIIATLNTSTYIATKGE